MAERGHEHLASGRSYMSETEPPKSTPEEEFGKVQGRIRELKDAKEKLEEKRQDLECRHQELSDKDREFLDSCQAKEAKIDEQLELYEEALEQYRMGRCIVMDEIRVVVDLWELAELVSGI